jgi:hypothetical protein
VYLFPLVVFVVDSKGRLAALNARWSFDISVVVKYCVLLTGLVRSRVHLSRLVRSSMNLHISPTDMNILITTRTFHLLYENVSSPICM